MCCEFEGAIVKHYSKGSKRRATSTEIEQVLKTTAVRVRGGSEPSEVSLSCAFSEDADERKRVLKRIILGEFSTLFQTNSYRWFMKHDITIK